MLGRPGWFVGVPRSPTLKASRFALGLLLCALLSGCFTPGDVPDAGRRELRLVDPGARGSMRIDLGGERGRVRETPADATIGTSAYPVATINHDTRYVLAAPVVDWLLVQSGAEVPGGGTLELSPGYPPHMPVAKKLLLAPRAKLDGEWRSLGLTVVDTASKGGTHHVPFTLELGDAASGKQADLHVDVYPLDWGDEQTYETAMLEITARARLDFAFGILEPAWHCGPVRFSIDWCEGSTCARIFDEVSDPSEPAQRAWHSRSVSLADFAGSRGRLLFKSTRADGNAEPFSFPVWANPTIVRPDKPASGPYNVILLSIDTQRADHLSSYGYEHDTSPFIDAELARKGVVFENMVAGASSTSPSHMTMFTGMQASAHGLTKGLEGLVPWLYTVTESIRAAGYETGAVTEDGWLGFHHGFGRGFNVYVENRSANIMAPTGQVDVTFGRAKRWLERHKDRRFFLFLHTFQVHDPFSPPAQYRSMFRTHDGAPIDENSPWYLQWLAAYDQEIRYTDDELHGLWRTVEELGLADDTIFILTSDHGESFMEHGYFGHGAHLHESVVKVPFIVRGPGVGRNVRVAQPVGHVDLAPTILDLMGIDDLPDQLQGRSLVPQLSGTAPATDDERVYFTESWSPIARNAAHGFVRFQAPAFAARKGSLKLSRYNTLDGVDYEAFDLSTDPGERDNLWPGERERFAELEALLENYEAGMHAFRASLVGGDIDATDTDPEAIDLDPEQEEKLRALGYLN